MLRLLPYTFFLVGQWISCLLAGISQDLDDQCPSRVKLAIQLEKGDVSVACTC